MNRVMTKTATAAIVVMLFTNTCCALSRDLEFRDGDIQITAPDTLKATEYIGEICCYEDDYELITQQNFALYDENTSLIAEYVCCGSNLYIGSTQNAEDANEWYDLNKDLIKVYLNEEIGGYRLAEKAVFVKSDDLDEGWIRIKCDESSHGGTMYLYLSVPDESTSFRSIQYRKWNDNDESIILTKKELVDLDQTVQSYCDYGIDIEEDSDDDTDGGFWGGLIASCIAASIGAICTKNKNKNTKKHAIKFHSDKKLIRNNVDCDVICQNECSYEKSLRTMCESGIMTRAEMNEMLQKHNIREAGRRK